jgi:hypothetical protein
VSAICISRNPEDIGIRANWDRAAQPLDCYQSIANIQHNRFVKQSYCSWTDIEDRMKEVEHLDLMI